MKHETFLSLIAAGAVLVSSTAIAEETVTTGRFRSIELRGGGHVVLRHGPEQRVTLLQGSTRFTRLHVRNEEQLVIDACNEECPPRYDVEIEIVTPLIEGIAVSGGGKVESETGFGHQQSIAAVIDGGGHIDIRSIAAQRADAAVNGGGSIDLRAERRLQAAVDGGGHIAYWGDPSVTSAVSGGGSVSKGG